MIASELIAIAAGTGIMPSNPELLGMGRSDLANQVTKKGGFVAWGERLGLSRKPSASDTGWDGENALASLLEQKGFHVARPEGVKAPYDLIVDQVLRVDVKTAKFAEYGVCRGWFYRVGKAVQADILALFQSDTGACYFLPWNIGPQTNITIASDGGKYRLFKDRYDILRELAAARHNENGLWP